MWTDSPENRSILDDPRRDILHEVERSPGVFTQAIGPFSTYERTVQHLVGSIEERVSYRLRIPWVGFLFALPVWWLMRRGRSLHTTTPPFWAPPDVLNERHMRILGLLAVGSMASAFTNTLFTQTAQFAAADFGVSDTAFGIAGSLVRAGIVFALPLAIVADRVGRRRAMTIAAWLAPLICSLGALAPTFGFLVATQSVGRPLGLALDFLIAVVLTEEMPKSSRAYGVSVMALASGFGAGLAVMVLPLADLGPDGWRWVYVVTLLWLFVAADLTRRLPETRRFIDRPTHRTRLRNRRFWVIAAIAAFGNMFIAPVSFFQNRFLYEVRGFNATDVALFTMTTATPAALGLAAGGKMADIFGRRPLICFTLPVAALLLVAAFTFAGPAMWLFTLFGGLLGGASYPALAVYRTELFPTGRRSTASGLLTASALIGGIIGLLGVGALLDRGWSYAEAIGLTALGEVVVVIIVLAFLPETAHQELETLNPEDNVAAQR